MEETKNEALVKAEPQLELTHDGKGNERTIARAANGKFAKKHRAAVEKSIRSTIDFLEAKAPGETKSRADAMRDHLYDCILKASPEDLVGMTKAIEAFEKMAYGSKAKDRITEEAKDYGVRVIVVPMPVLSNPTIDNPQISTPVRPSFADAEVVYTNPRNPEANR